MSMEKHSLIFISFMFGYILKYISFTKVDFHQRPVFDTFLKFELSYF